MEMTRILVMDDEPNIVNYLKSYLEASDYEVFTAMDGTEGLRIFERELPDLVLLDIRMPEVSGFEVCRRIREWSQTPIIMLTALDSVADKVKAFDIGADGYITKPFGEVELLARISSLLRRTATKDEPH